MTRSGCLAVLSVGALCVLPVYAQQGHEAGLRPALYRSDFRPNPGAYADSGSRDGWESFPISQETGYDPTINPETSQGESALVREMAPTQDGPFRLGFIRRINMVSGAGASLRVKVRAPFVSGDTAIEVLVFRGEKEEREAATIHGGSWQEIVCPIASSPTAITAVAIAAVFPHGFRNRAERFLMKDVRLKALAIQRLELSDADFLWDASRKLFYRKKTLHPGDDLDIRARVGQQNDARWTLTAPDGSRVADGVGGNALYRLPQDAADGIWTLHIEGRDAQATALLLVRPQHPSGLLFDQPPSISAALLTSIRERKALLKKTTDVESGMNIDRFDPHWLLAGLPSYFTITLQPSELAMLEAIEFRATGDPVARDEACRLLEGIARWRMWVHPWFPAHGYHSYYPVGIMTKYVVMAELFLGDALSAEDRKNLDRSLMELSVKPAYEEYVLEDRLQFNTSNWIGNTVGGALLAALQSDEPDAAGYALGLYSKDRDHIEAAYTPDGSYGEGVTYQRFDLEMTTLVAEAAKRQLGRSVDRFLVPPERYMRYASYGKDGLLDYGDTHTDIRPSNVFAYMAAQNKSSTLHDFYFRYRDEGTTELLSRVLWESAIKPVRAVQAPEPASALFDRRGIVVLRDGVDPAATVIAMRAGKNFNHNHADEGSVFFAHGGKLWLGEAGYADYYKDPSYSTFNIQAVGHNTLLVNGNPASQVLPGNAVFGVAPTFTHTLLGRQASLVQADLSAAYGGSVERYTRSLFFQAGGPLVVIDDVSAASPRKFTQVWHPEQQASLYPAPRNGFRLSDGTTEVDVRAFANGSLTTTQSLSPLPLVDYEKAEHELIRPPVQFEISDANPRANETIVTLIEPHDHSQEVESAAKWVTTANASTLVMTGSGIEIQRSRTDAGCRQITAWWRDGGLLLCATDYKERHFDAGFSSDRPIDVQLMRDGDGIVRVEIEAAKPTALTLRNFQAVSQMPCGVRAGCSSRDTRVVSIPMGHTSMRLRYVDKRERN